jgi:hypothetical protein
VTISAALIGALVASSSAQSYLDGSSKARGDFGQMNRSYSTYRYAAPNVNRTFSYEPAPAVKTDKTDKTNSDSQKANNNTAPKAKAPSTTTRSYSYEPSMGASNNSRSSSTPLYLVPKTLR